MLEIVYTINCVVRTYRNAVGAPTESTFAPRRDERAISLIDHYAVIVAREEINSIARVNCDVSYGAGSNSPLRRQAPAFHQLVSQHSSHPLFSHSRNSDTHLFRQGGSLFQEKPEQGNAAHRHP